MQSGIGCDDHSVAELGEAEDVAIQRPRSHVTEAVAIQHMQRHRERRRDEDDAATERADQRRLDTGTQRGMPSGYWSRRRRTQRRLR